MKLWARVRCLVFLTHSVEGNFLTNESQHGFQKSTGRSCLTNLLSFLDITGYVDSGSAVDAVFLDFAKAFDQVPYKRPLAKLNSHGITGCVSKWIEEWLQARAQMVCVRGVWVT